MADTRRILAVKLADLGDVLVTEPALRSLRNGYPDAAIHVLTTPHASDLVRMLDPSLVPIPFRKSLFDRPQQTIRPANLATAGKLTVELRRAGYDLVVLLHHLTTPFGAAKFRALVQATGAPRSVGLDNGRGDFLTKAVDDLGFGERHEAEYMLAVATLAGGADVDPAPRVRVKGGVPESLASAGPYAALFPTTGPYSPAREWPPARFAELARLLVAQGLAPVVVGGNDARRAAARISDAASEAIDLTGKTDLAELARVVSGAALAVGGDSFVGHLAAAIGTPVVSIFGPSNVRAWKPFGATELPLDSTPTGSTGVVVREDLPCTPCLYTGYRLGRPQGCPTRTCIDAITVERVDETIRNLRGVSH